MFAGKLVPIPILYGHSEEPDVDGLYYPGPDRRIHVDSRCTTRQAILDTLAHEMVHQYQDQNALPLKHDRLFRDVKRQAATYGLNL